MINKYRATMFMLMISLFMFLGNVQADGLRDELPSDDPRPNELQLIQIPSKSNAVKFYQVIFDFEDW